MLNVYCLLLANNGGGSPLNGFQRLILLAPMPEASIIIAITEASYGKVVKKRVSDEVLRLNGKIDSE